MSQEPTRDLKFDEVFGSLNAEQQRAVGEIEGPVLVIAGPGTGKTQILAARIANILKQTDCLPENILCLTYTEAGAIAMRKRLQEFIGPDAFRVAIFTFHAFCHMVIQENLDYFGVRSLDPVSDLERIAFAHQIIDGFGKDHPLKRYTGDVYYEAKKLLELYEAMKRENWSSSFLSERIESYTADLPLRDEYIYKRDSKNGKKGTLKAALYEAELKRMRQLKAAAESFDAYRQLLKSGSRYDFADMILWVINAFEEDQALLNQYQERYQYFLVDEYQDTSGSQGGLLDLLVSFWNEPNLFCVGDDDQSIYRFQGANIENIHHFIGKYTPKVITLRENYRSTQLILDAAGALIGSNKKRLDHNKDLQAANPAYASLPVKPEIRAYYQQTHEAADIAAEIERLKESGIRLSEIAVLYRKHTQAEEIIRYLRSRNIAINTRRRPDLLKEPLIQKLITLLRYLAAEVKKPHTGEIYLYEILHFDFFNIRPLDIARVSVEVYRKNFSERVTSWREEIAIKAPQDLFTSAGQNIPPLAKASRLIEGWIAAAVNLTVQQLIERVLSESGILFAALTGEDKSWNMQLLHTFFDFVKDECMRKPGTNLQQLLATVALMEKEQVALPAQRILYAEDGVHFLTAHSSKGLEFEYVFIISCNSSAWGGTVPNRGFKLPDNIFNIPADDDDAEEDRRLFYVAMTRARKQLVISYAERDARDRELEKSRFIAELESRAGIVTAPFHVDDAGLLTFELSIMQSLPAAPEGLFDNALIDELLDKYSLSVTHLNAYLKCPVSFYFNNLIRVPAPINAGMTFGSAVHYALEKLFKNMNAHPEKQFASSQEMLRDFKWYMHRNEDAFTEKDFSRRLEYGEQVLPKFYERYIHEWNKITSIERSYRNVVVDGIPLNGKLDKLEFEGNAVNVVDYKTGQFKNAERKLKGPDSESAAKAEAAGKEIRFEDVFGGDYWRQAVFYKLLIDHDHTRSWEMRSTEFDFVEPDRDSGQFFKYRIMITPLDVEMVRGQIKTAYTGIKNKEFSKGCQKPDCEWCNFTRKYQVGNIEVPAGETGEEE